MTPLNDAMAVATGIYGREEEMGSANANPSASAIAPTSDAEPSASVRPGLWALVEHWRGPIILVEKVSAKRITPAGGGHIPPEDVRAVFETEGEAEAGLRRKRAAWAAAQDELKVFEAARREASAALLAAERRLKAASWAAAREAKPTLVTETGGSECSGTNPFPNEATEAEA